MKGKRSILIFCCASLWLAAGINVVRMGLIAQKTSLMGPVVTIIGIIMVFLMFGFMFVKISTKNVKRIGVLPEEKLKIWNCMPLKSFIIMVGMITLGVCLRRCESIPRGCIASFYIGLGSGLSLAGLVYLLTFVKGLVRR